MIPQKNSRLPGLSEGCWLSFVNSPDIAGSTSLRSAPNTEKNQSLLDSGFLILEWTQNDLTHRVRHFFSRKDAQRIGRIFYTFVHLWIGPQFAEPVCQECFAINTKIHQQVPKDQNRIWVMPTHNLLGKLSVICSSASVDKVFNDQAALTPWINAAQHFQNIPTQWTGGVGIELTDINMA